MRTDLNLHRFTPPPVAALPDEARLLLKASRMWVMLARHQRNPKPVLRTLLNNNHAAFCTMMEAVVTCWPDTYTSFAPCASEISPDEATLLDLMAEAADDNEPAAHKLLEEMLPVTDRVRLFQAAQRATAATAYPW